MTDKPLSSAQKREKNNKAKRIIQGTEQQDVLQSILMSKMGVIKHLFKVFKQFAAG